MLTYIPYLGALVGIGILSLAALLAFDDLGHALAVPAVYLVVSFLEGNFVTPLVLGRRLTLNPVVIFVGLLFWFFLGASRARCWPCPPWPFSDRLRPRGHPGPHRRVPRPRRRLGRRVLGQSILYSFRRL